MTGGVLRILKIPEDPKIYDWPTGLYAFTKRVVPKAPIDTEPQT